MKRFDNLPYLQTEVGYFVEVAVTVQGVTLSQVHLVLDARNRPIEVPNSFDINTSIQKCLAKGIALHGLGLYIYAGEDVPAADTDSADTVAPPDSQKPVLATLSAEQVARIKVLLGEAGMTLNRLIAYFRVNSLAEIRASDFPRVVSTLENARRRAA